MSMVSRRGVNPANKRHYSCVMNLVPITEYVKGVRMLVKFEIYSDGTFWCSRGIGVDIFTQEKTLDELMGNIREAVELHFEGELAKGASIRILTISECEVGPVARAAGC